MSGHAPTPGESDRSRVYAYSGGFLTQRRVRRILHLAGYDLRLGLPGPDDLVGVWGNSPTAWRGQRIARTRNVPLLHLEDAFLRSIHPGRAGEPPVGLLLDRAGLHFDPSHPSGLEQILSHDPLDDTAILDRARGAIARIRDHHLSKYNTHDTALRPPDPGYVLVLDQVRDDASVTASKGNDALFREMLVFAQEEHPGARVIIKTHPETRAGFRSGYYSETDASNRVSLRDDPLSPWEILDGAVGVYTVSSHLGFEAILAGHRPRVFGQPFYSGWGLSTDQNPVPRRTRKLTRAQIFAAAMILYPTWYDPFRDRLCELETVLDNLEAQVRAWREDRQGWVASGIRLWKRRPMQQTFGSVKRVKFDRERGKFPDRRHMIWGSARSSANDTIRVEDGFLRSRGLGASLVPALSLALDDLGIYYDPNQPSRLETFVAARQTLRPDQSLRVERLITTLIRNGLSKYNVGGPATALPEGHRILVPGQVEDDASIRLGTGNISTNAALLRAVRLAHPDASVIYKPHPDVEAGLRPGVIDAVNADMVATKTDPTALLEQVDEVWTMTSLLGFEALLRRIPVTTVGAPFYAGWGLTTDLGDIPERRRARPDLLGLAHAALIDYPRYFDPVTGQTCPVEVVVDRLNDASTPRPGPVNRTVSKLQGLFATYAYLWR
ncbi:capsular polysaccharide biosynthesis protein [Sedimentitalea todarodis]|uniref:Capsular polysaccharide biosynthesis protein n=1 Tax=Sedimentitalea todarodis TaxID=1631240 RepID=A0ABU3VBE9_9RHOB|nr:capsular polysaccharide biosynthesis protein [Sedimentitalea todarodis]MDU9003500.1 capsular polysaccharide biosynthesis protein [Sedimentitalea todarodis]